MVMDLMIYGEKSNSVPPDFISIKYLKLLSDELSKSNTFLSLLILKIEERSLENPFGKQIHMISSIEFKIILTS